MSPTPSRAAARAADHDRGPDRTDPGPPADPAGTRPKHDPASLVPRSAAEAGAARGRRRTAVDAARGPAPPAAATCCPSGAARPASRPVDAGATSAAAPRAALPVPARRAGRRSAIAALAAAVVILPARRAARPDGRPGVVGVAADASGAVGARADRRPRRRAIPPGQRRPARAGHRRPARVRGHPAHDRAARAGRPGRRHPRGQRRRACSTGCAGWAPNCSINFGQAVGERAPAAAPRGARARALLVPLPRRPTRSSCSCPPAPKARSPIPRRVFFRRGDVAAQLSRPLTPTLDAHDAAAEHVTSSPDAGLVERLTTRMFSVLAHAGQPGEPRVPGAPAAATSASSRRPRDHRDADEEVSPAARAAAGRRRGAPRDARL